MTYLYVYMAKWLLFIFYVMHPVVSYRDIKEINTVNITDVCIFSNLCYTGNMFQLNLVIIRPSVIITNDSTQLQLFNIFMAVVYSHFL